MDDLHSLYIGKRRIGDDTRAYIIAEIGHNHCGDITKAFELMRKAKEVGADAVKTQTRNNKRLFTEGLFNSPYDNENSYGKTYGEHREALEFGRGYYKELALFAAELGIDFFSTPFDEESAELLHELKMPLYKIASGDITNIPLLQRVARFKRPILLSTGRASIDDIFRAVEAITKYHENIAILQCTASYPCAFEELNLKVIETYRKLFPYCVGISSHDNGIAMAPVAYTLGARIIEKHFTLNHTWKGTDHAFSLEPPGLSKMIRDVHRAKDALGDGVKKSYPSEEKGIFKMAKAIYAARSLPVGLRLTEADLAVKSPADGLPPYMISKLIGRLLKVAVEKDESILLDYLEVEP
jgi:N-acetylneuraminate synthase/sialic acid synthase